MFYNFKQTNEEILSDSDFIAKLFSIGNLVSTIIIFISYFRKYR